MIFQLMINQIKIKKIPKFKLIKKQIIYNKKIKSIRVNQKKKLNNLLMNNLWLLF